MTPNGSHVFQLEKSLSAKLKMALVEQEFEITQPAYTQFSAKKKGLSCILYDSGKLVVQGKESAHFIEFFLEPEILGTFTATHPMAEMNVSARIGIDESGKGDFFGPLCIAGVYASGKDFEELQSIGVKDSKDLSDRKIQTIATKIKSKFLHHVVRINPAKYNEIYSSFKNLNRLLAWGHATTIEHLVEKSGCRKVIIDQFADESVVITALKRKGLEVDLTQRHRAEEDLVVAAASILARDAFLEGLQKLSQEVGFNLPKGASSLTIEIGCKILAKWGKERLMQVCKQHFKTFQIVMGKTYE